MSVYSYEKVSPSEVSQPVRELAEVALRFAQADLGLTQPMLIQWFRGGRSITREFAQVDLHGLSHRPDPHIILVSAELSPGQAASCVLHESRHHWQWKTKTCVDPEKDAKRYAHWGIRALQVRLREFVEPKRTAIVSWPPRRPGMFPRNSQKFWELRAGSAR